MSCMTTEIRGRSEKLTFKQKQDYTVYAVAQRIEYEKGNISLLTVHENLLKKLDEVVQ